MKVFRDMIRKTFFSIGLALTLATSAAAQERVVNVYNWSDYVDPKMLEAFTKDTGIKVVYDTYDNNEIIETKLLAGKSGYDVVVPSGPFLQRMIRAGVFQKLDKDKLTNLKNMWPEIMERLAVYDPGNQYAINYMWGTTGIGLNVAKVRERLGADVPLDSFDLLMKPEISAKLKDCGIHVLDSPEDFLPGILNYLGLDPNSRNAEDFQKVADALGKVRANIQKFHSSEYINSLANGEICMAVGYSGDIIQARNRAKEAKNKVEIAYIVPKEGALMWFDSFVITADAQHPNEAHAFIDYMMRPDVAAANANFVSYASGALAAKPLVKPEIAADTGVYPNDETMKHLFTTTAYDEKTQRLVTRLWTRIKSGR